MKSVLFEMHLRCKYLLSRDVWILKCMYISLLNFHLQLLDPLVLCSSSFRFLHSDFLKVIEIYAVAEISLYTSERCCLRFSRVFSTCDGSKGTLIWSKYIYSPFFCILLFVFINSQIQMGVTRNVWESFWIFNLFLLGWCFVVTRFSFSADIGQIFHLRR